MTRKSLDEVRVLVATVINNNNNYDVKPSELREVFMEFFNAVAPAYGTLTLAGPNAQVLGTVPVRMQWSSGSTSNPAEITASAATGAIVRSERGTTQINFTVDFYCTDGRDVTFELWRINNRTGWSVTATGRGDGNYVSVNFAAIDYWDPAPDYYIMVSCEVNGTTVALANGSLVAQIKPVNSYV